MYISDISLQNISPPEINSLNHDINYYNELDVGISVPIQGS